MDASRASSLEYWKGKRVLVSGGGGFLGSFVVGRLQQLSPAQIFAPPSRDYDLRETESVHRVIADTRPDIIIHMAARVGGIGANQKHPAEFFYDNLRMGVEFLHAAWKYGVEKFVTIGTVCSYPKVTPVPFKEENLWEGYPEETNAPYGLAKKTLLVQSMAYRQQYGFNSIFLLPANLYGPGDNFDPDSSHVIPALIRKVIEAKEKGEEKLVVWGTGNPTREFLYVSDAAEGILLAAQRYNESAPVNLGVGSEISIRDLASLIVRLTGFQGSITWDKSKPDGQPRRSLDTQKAERFFGFRAKVPFEEGLRNTIEWFEKHRAQQFRQGITLRTITFSVS